MPHIHQQYRLLRSDAKTAAAQTGATQPSTPAHVDDCRAASEQKDWEFMHSSQVTQLASSQMTQAAGTNSRKGNATP